MNATPPTTPPPTAPALPPPPVVLWRGRDRLLAALAASLLLVGTVTAMVRVGDRRDGAAVPGASDVVTPRSVNDVEQQSAWREAGCEMLVLGEPFRDRTHLDPDEDVDAAVLYPRDRPAHSGRHRAQVLPLPTRIPNEPIDERVVVHNMEHGSVVVWFDGGRTAASSQATMESWMQERRTLGFASPAAGGVFVSPADVIASGKAVALRAWGVALDCDRFDVVVADAFLQRHWGSRGASPEADLSPFPVGVMREVGRPA